jgi:N-methylhydantoinase A
VVRVANATIERALRVISVERGHDVRDAALVAFGGGGGAHAAELATLLGAREVLVPPLAGLLSAWGLLGADELHLAARTLLATVPRDAAWPAREVAAAVRGLREELVRRHGATTGERFEVTLALRYEGQSFELPLPVGAPAVAAKDPRAAFDRAHARRFGYMRTGAALQIVEVALAVRRAGPTLPVSRPRARTTRVARLGTTRLHGLAASDKGRLVPVWRREELGRDFVATGPALVLEYGATTHVPPGYRARVDAHGNLRLTPVTRGRP